MNPAFWQGRRVFLTGHTGFKGGWSVTMLRELGASVTGYALAPPTNPAMFDELGLADACTHVPGDIRDIEALERAMRDADPEIVFHLAAQPLVRASYGAPVETYAVNVMGTVNVLDACRRMPSLRAAVIITTDKCYENIGSLWGYREVDRLGGADPYSNSKAACELVVDAYRSSFFRPDRHQDHGVGLASARAGNVIGGGDFAEDRLVPDAIRAFSAQTPLMIRNRASIRPWQHVLEPLSGYLMLAERLYDDPSFASAWNFGPPVGDSAPVSVVADHLSRLWGEGAAWRQDPGEHPYEAATLKLDCTKAQVELGWVPKLTLEAALELTVKWYREHHKGGDVAALTRRQVLEYLSMDEAHG